MTNKWVVVLMRDSSEYYEFKMLVMEGSRDELLEKAQLSRAMHEEVLGEKLSIWSILRITERPYVLDDLEKTLSASIFKWEAYSVKDHRTLRERWFCNNVVSYLMLQEAYNKLPKDSKLKQQMCRFFGSLDHCSFVNGNLEVGLEALINN